MLQDSTHTRRWSRFSLATMFVVVMVAAIWFGVMIRPRPFPYAFPDPEKQIQDVELLLGPEQARMRLSISNPPKIDTMVNKPFGLAQKDPRPARYVSIGTLFVHYSDGSEEGAWLFAPFGHFKCGDEYGIADLSSLHNECRQMLLQSSDPNAAWLLNNSPAWK